MKENDLKNKLIEATKRFVLNIKSKKFFGGKSISVI